MRMKIGGDDGVTSMMGGSLAWMLLCMVEKCCIIQGIIHRKKRIGGQIVDCQEKTSEVGSCRIAVSMVG